jgi:hypothetical protein
VIGQLVGQVPKYTVGSKQAGHIGAALPAVLDVVRLLAAAAAPDAVVAFLRQHLHRPGRGLRARTPAVHALVAPHRRALVRAAAAAEDVLRHRPVVVAELLVSVRGGVVVRGVHPRQPLRQVGRRPGLLLLAGGRAGLAHDGAGQAQLDALDGVVGLGLRREAAGRRDAGAARDRRHVGHRGRREVGGALLGEEVEHLVLEAPQRGLGEVGHLRRRQRGGDLGHEVREGLVRDGVDAHPGQLLLQLGVPVVLDVVVRPTRQLRRDHRPPARARVCCTLLVVRTGTHQKRHDERGGRAGHLLPTTECSLMMVCSSASVNSPCLRSGRR